MVWLCKCDCGSDKIVKVIGADLKSGKVKSCGCHRAGRLGYGESAFNRLYNTYLRRATGRKMSFEFTKEEFKDITSRNCYYCGRRPSQKAVKKDRARVFGEYVYNGIDRIDSSIGYTKKNSLPCCGRCNVAKNNMSFEEFIKLINDIYFNLRNLK
jgi:hypothetical protein